MAMNSSELAELLEVVPEEVQTLPSPSLPAPPVPPCGWDPIDLTRRIVLSCERGHTDIVRLLIEAAASVDQPNSRGVPPIFAASDRGHVDCVRLLLESRAQPSAEGATAGQSSLGRQKRSALHAVCKRGHVQVARLLVEASANVDHLAPPPWGTPLHTSCRFQRVELVALLLDHSASIEGVGSSEQLESPLLVACRVGNPATVELLINRGANVHRLCAGKLPLLAAIEAGHLPIVQLLLNAEASANACADDGVTPLLASCRQGDAEVTKLLMVHGAATDPRGAGLVASEAARAAGHYACAEVIQLAMEAHATAAALELLEEERRSQQLQPVRASKKSKGRRRPSLNRDQKAAALLANASLLDESERYAALMQSSPAESGVITNSPSPEAPAHATAAVDACSPHSTSPPPKEGEEGASVHAGEMHSTRIDPHGSGAHSPTQASCTECGGEWGAGQAPPQLEERGSRGEEGSEASGQTEKLLLSVKALRRQLAAQQQELSRVQSQLEKAREQLAVSRGERLHEELLQLPLEELERAERGAVRALVVLQPAVADKRNMIQAAKRTEEEEGRQCIICFERQKETVFVPCGHLVTCCRCAELVQYCPSCRQSITSKIRTFQD